MPKFFISILILFLSLINLKAVAESPKDIYKKYSSSILLIFDEENDGEHKSLNYGTAFAIDKSGLLLTSAHLIKNNSAIKDQTGRVFTITNTVWSNPKADLALIKVAGQFQPIPLESSINSEIGEELTIISNPSGFQNTLSTGILSAFRKNKTNSLVQLQHTSPISPGSSGGPMFNKDGKVIGIVQGIYVNEHSQNLNVGMPIEYLPNKYLEANKAQTQNNNINSNVSYMAYSQLLQDIQPNTVEDYILRGLVKQKMQDYNGAIQDFKTAQWLLEKQKIELGLNY